ncbi:MAG: DUF4920 domain-containing protein [Chryseolinea sp.]
MKILITFIAFCLIAFGSYAQPPDVPVTPGSNYGSAISASGAVAAAELPKLLQDGQPHDVKVTAVVSEVCPKMGCWMTLEMADKTAVFVNMKDYGFFVPAALKGKTVVIDGQATVKKITVDELRHYAEDSKKSKDEIAAINQPKEEIRLTANGIVVVQ